MIFQVKLIHFSLQFVILNDIFFHPLYRVDFLFAQFLFSFSINLVDFLNNPVLNDCKFILFCWDCSENSIDWLYGFRIWRLDGVIFQGNWNSMKVGFSLMEAPGPFLIYRNLKIFFPPIFRDKLRFYWVPKLQFTKDINRTTCLSSKYFSPKK